MAFYVKLTKTFEDTNIAKYNFGEDDATTGVLVIDKLSGEVTLVTALKGDDRSLLFNRAGAKIRKEWKKGGFPNSTEWAS